MQLKVLSDDARFIEQLVKTRFPTDQAVAKLSFEAGTVRRIPGATGGWFELLCNLGVIALPAGIVGNLIASWIWSALKDESLPRTERQVIRLVLRNGDKVADLQIHSDNFETTREAVKEALDHVNREP